jgi:hypothetical protein
MGREFLYAPEVYGLKIFCHGGDFMSISNLCHLSFLFKADMVTMTAVVKHCSSCSASALMK